MTRLRVIKEGGITAEVNAAIAAQKAAANGIAPLGASSKVPAANSLVHSVAGRTGAIVLGVADVSGAIPATEKAIANGVATLGADGKLPSAQTGPLAISETFVVNTQAAMLAVSAGVGDVAVRTDQKRSYILRVEPASTLANWQELETPTDTVLSVDGRVGAVSLSDLYVAASHAGSGGTAHAGATTTIAGFQSAADKTKLDGIAEGGGTADATVLVKGKARASVAPALATDPVFVGDNDPRVRPPEAYLAPTMVNGWVNYGLGFDSAGYRKEPTGVVRLKGLIAGGTQGPTVTIFTLPAGYRPAAKRVFSSISFEASAYFASRVDVNTTGQVVAVRAGADYLTLDGMTFDAA